MARDNQAEGAPLACVAPVARREPFLLEVAGRFEKRMRGEYREYRRGISPGRGAD